MINTCTFLIYLVLCNYLLEIHCLKLDIGQIVNYSKEESSINVWEDREYQNLYTHNLDEPEFLKDVYNKDKKLYFNPLLTNNQALLSATVLWVEDNPLVVQLNLENSSLVLLNDYDSTLSVQAIFSERTDINLNIEKHLDTEKEVDIELSKNEDYVSNSVQVQVTKLELSDPKFKRFGLKYYNLESNKLGVIKYNDTEILTIIEESTEQTTDTQKQTTKKEVSLDIPSKNEVYGIYVYYYYNYPLLLEVLYSLNKRVFFAHTPRDKWHRIYLPSYNDPSYQDFLFKRLNYYACVNKYKWTIDISVKTDLEGHYYLLNNYCLGSDGVENYEIKIFIPFYTDGDYNYGKYRCFEHRPDSKTKFYLDYLKDKNRVLQIQNTPNVIDYLRVYHHLDLAPLLMVFVTPEKTMHYYVYEDRNWRSYEFEEESEDNRFSDKMRRLLDELVADYKGEKKVPSMKLNDEALGLLTDHSKILTLEDREYDIETVVFDKRKASAKLNHEYDIWWYNSSSYSAYVNYEGNLNYDLRVTTKDDYCLKLIKYYRYNIHNFEQNIFVHRIDYHYDYDTYEMTVHLYTNILYVYTFRKNYYEYSYIPWKFIGIKPMRVLEELGRHRKYYETVNKLNNLSLKVDEYVESPIVYLDKAKDVRILEGSNPRINTIYYDSLNDDKIKRVELELTELEKYEDCLTVEGELDKTIKIKTRDLCGINHIKYNKHTIKHFTDKKTLVHCIEYTKTDSPYSITVILYTNTLYVYTFKSTSVNNQDSDWQLLHKEPAKIDKTKNQEKYFKLTKNLENFDFKP